MVHHPCRRSLLSRFILDINTARLKTHFAATGTEVTETEVSVRQNSYGEHPTCPPGQQDTRMRPTARGGERLSACIVHTVSRKLNFYFLRAIFTALLLNDQPKARCNATLLLEQDCCPLCCGIAQSSAERAAHLGNAESQERLDDVLCQVAHPDRDRILHALHEQVVSRPQSIGQFSSVH